MLILGSSSYVDNGILIIPDYHRGHLSLKSGTDVTIAYLPGKPSNPYPTLSEIIISPISFKSWQYMTRVNSRVVNRPGVLRKLMHALAEEDLDILYHASGPLENGRFQRIEFLVDAHEYYTRFERLKTVNKDPDPYILFELERKLKSLLINELCFDGQRARLKVRPMEAFRRAWKAYRMMLMNDEQSRPLKGIETIEKGSLRLPNLIIDRTGSNFNIMLNSDTKDRMLRAIVLDEPSRCTFLRVVHNDRPGSSARICSSLSSEFQIVTTLSRIKRQGGSSDFEFMLYSPRYAKAEDEVRRRGIIESLLSDQDLQDLDIRVSYPEEIGSVGPEPHAPEATTEINEQSSPLPEIDHCRIFASYPYAFERLYKVLEEYLLGQGFEVVTGKGIDGRAAFRDTIIERINSCHGFVGIWKFDESLGPIKFSPWLSWELGIAQANGMPVRICPHEAMSTGDFMPHRTILPDINMPPFSDIDFRNYLADNLKTLKESAQNYEWSRKSKGFNQYSQTN
jgi:hypothetical protein